MGVEKKVLVIVFLGLILRLVLLNQSLWLDEAIGAIAARDYSYSKIIGEVMRFDHHPPMYYFVLKFWSSIFGYSESVLRLPSVLFGIGTIILTYKIAMALRLGNSLVLLLLLATSPLHVYYSQEARMYSMAACFAALAVYCFLKERWYLFSISVLVLAFTDYMPWFLFPIFFIWGLVNKQRPKWFMKLTATFVPLVAALAIWLPVLTIQLAHGEWLLATLPAWAEIAGGANFKQLILVWMKFVLGRVTLFDKAFYYSLVAISSLPEVVGLAKAASSLRKYLIVWLWLLVPLSLGFLFSIHTPAFTYFRYIYVLPAFYLLVFIGIMKLHKFFRSLALIMVLSVNLLGLGIYYCDSKQHREAWRAAVQFVENKARMDEIILFHYPEPFAPYRWYSTEKVLAYGVTDSISANESGSTVKTAEAIQKASGVYVFDYLRELSDPSNFVASTLEKKGLSLKEKYDFRGVGFIEYWTN